MVKPKINSDEFEKALGQNLDALRPALPKTSSNPGRYLVCLGESHGSHLFGMKSRILPGTGALLIRVPSLPNSDVLIDPGWGTIASSRRLNVDITGVRLILLSHCHLDHVGDLHPVLLTLSLAGARPTLVGNSTSIQGGKGQPSVLPEYFRNLCRRVIVASPGKSLRLTGVRIVPFATAHRENPRMLGQSLGYVVIYQEKPVRIGVVTDGPLGTLSETVISTLRKCSALVINVGTISTCPDSPSHSRVFDNALCFHGLDRFLNQLAAKPNQIKSIGITHLGAELLEVRAPAMKRFLTRINCSDLPSLIEACLTSMIMGTLGKHVRASVLREGNRMEV